MSFDPNNPSAYFAEFDLPQFESTTTAAPATALEYASSQTQPNIDDDFFSDMEGQPPLPMGSEAAFATQTPKYDSSFATNSTESPGDAMIFNGHARPQNGYQTPGTGYPQHTATYHQPMMFHLGNQLEGPEHSFNIPTPTYTPAQPHVSYPSMPPPSMPPPSMPPPSMPPPSMPPASMPPPNLAHNLAQNHAMSSYLPHQPMWTGYGQHGHASPLPQHYQPAMSGQAPHFSQVNAPQQYNDANSRGRQMGTAQSLVSGHAARMEMLKRALEKGQAVNGKSAQAVKDPADYGSSAGIGMSGALLQGEEAVAATAEPFQKNQRAAAFSNITPTAASDVQQPISSGTSSDIITRDELLSGVSVPSVIAALDPSNQLAQNSGAYPYTTTVAQIFDGAGFQLKYGSADEARNHAFRRIKLSEIKNDDVFDRVKNDMRTHVFKVMKAISQSSFLGHENQHSHKDQPLTADEKAEWLRWQNESGSVLNHVMSKFDKTLLIPQIEAKAWLIVEEIIKVHEIGYRPVNKADTTSICSKRLENAIDCIKNFMKVRLDVFQGFDLQEFASNPQECGQSKVSNAWNNYTKKQKNNAPGEAPKSKSRAVTFDSTAYSRFYSKDEIDQMRDAERPKIKKRGAKRARTEDPTEEDPSHKRVKRQPKAKRSATQGVSKIPSLEQVTKPPRRRSTRNKQAMNDGKNDQDSNNANTSSVSLDEDGTGNEGGLKIRDDASEDQLFYHDPKVHTQLSPSNPYASTASFSSLGQGNMQSGVHRSNGARNAPEANVAAQGVNMSADSGELHLGGAGYGMTPGISDDVVAGSEDAAADAFRGAVEDGLSIEEVETIFRSNLGGDSGANEDRHNIDTLDSYGESISEDGRYSVENYDTVGATPDSGASEGVSGGGRQDPITALLNGTNEGLASPIAARNTSEANVAAQSITMSTDSGETQSVNEGYDTASDMSNGMVAGSEDDAFFSALDGISDEEWENMARSDFGGGSASDYLGQIL